MARKIQSEVSFAFFEYIQAFIRMERKRVYKSFTPLTKKFLNFNNPKENAAAYLRIPQFEALETYAFLKEFCNNAQLWKIFEEWYYRTGVFKDRSTVGVDNDGQLELFDISEVGQETTKAVFMKIFEQMKSLQLSYPNYIYALTMGLGKTVLMATCIFYEFLLAKKYPKDLRFCHNVLVFAPDKTVLQSLREIQTFDKSKVIPSEYLSVIEANIKFHYLDEAGGTLNIIDRSTFNVIISNTQKIILKKSHKERTPMQSLFSEETSKYKAISNDWAKLASEAGLTSYSDIENENDLLSNQRFLKLLRLENLGIYVDEAHHVFGKNLSDDLMSTSKATSLRVTINEIAAQLEKAGSHLTVCANFTGTPYVKNQLLPEVVYSYGLSKAIDARYLKRAKLHSISNIKEDTEAFCRIAIRDFWGKFGDQRFEGMLPKIAFFAATIGELQKTLRPAIEKILIEQNIDTDKILVNVGDSTITSNDDEREFKTLDSVDSNKQFILLVNKGREGWNCRSLFGVALYREPKSKIFVLQATMRCLRQITDVQQEGNVYLSDDCYKILENELSENFAMSIDELANAGSNNKNIAKIRIVPPKVKVKLNRIHRLFKQREKQLKDRVNFKLSEIDLSQYSIIDKISSIDNTERIIKQNVITDARSNRIFTPYMLVAEIARYIQLNPIRIQHILEDSVDGIDNIAKYVSEHNDLLYKHIIPLLFNELFEITSYEDKEEVEIDLVKEPKDGSDHYCVTYKNENLLASVSDTKYAPYKNKSFNVDNYCFDSKPESQLFWTLLLDKKVNKVWFSGMLTHVKQISI